MTRLIQTQFRLKRNEFELDIKLDLPSRGVTVIFGPSGSGKTTFIRCIAGLERNAEGSIIFNDQPWQKADYFLPCYKRCVGYVFQEASLFEHLNTEQNLRYALKRAPSSRSVKKTVISFDDVVALLNLSKLLKRNTYALSGGERQRIAIARALLIQPELLLMDEPLASLDDALKNEVMPYLLRIKNEMSLPIIYITHSTDELMRLADHVGIIDQGHVKAFGAPEDLFAELDAYLGFDGESGVLLSGHVSEIDKHWSLAKASIGSNSLWIQNNNFVTGQHIRLKVLSKDVSLTLDKPLKTSILNVLSATVIEIKQCKDRGTLLIKLSASEVKLVALISARSAHNLNVHVNQQLWAQVKSVAIVY